MRWWPRSAIRCRTTRRSASVPTPRPCSAGSTEHVDPRMSMVGLEFPGELDQPRDRAVHLRSSAGSPRARPRQPRVPRIQLRLHLPRERGDHGARAHLPSGSGQTGVWTATQAGDLPCRVARSAATSRSDPSGSDPSPRHPPRHLPIGSSTPSERRRLRRARRRAARAGERGIHAHGDGCNDPRTPAPVRNWWSRLGRFAAVVHCE
jgi:hypothetical protein